MLPSDYPPVVAIAMLAAIADGETSAAEQQAINAAVQRLGSPDVQALVGRVAMGQVTLQELVKQLSDDESRRVAYEIAVAVCHADGVIVPAEQAFLDGLRSSLGLNAAAVSQIGQTAQAIASAPIASSAPAASSMDNLILEQAILTGALEILPDRLANIAVLPLQLRLVYEIGKQHGQQLDANQVKDLAATLGLGAAAQAVEGILMKVVGGLAGGLLGGLIGGAGRVATGATVTFAATYALGHVAQQYYAQGRTLSPDDLKALFARFQQEATTMYPRVEAEIRARAGTLNLEKVVAMVRR